MERTWKPTAAGILSIIAGAGGIIGGIVFAVPAIIDDIGPGIFLSVSYIICGIIAIVSGIYALRRRIWGLALAGSICAIWSGPSWILGILAVIFVSLGKGEFK